MIEELFDQCLITEDIQEIESYINKTWPKFETELEVKLKDLFKEPKNKGLKHIWKYGAADLVIRKNNKLICIIESGGSHHFTDEKQIKNDARKFKLCEINNVKCLQMVNGVKDKLSNRKWRKLLGKYLFRN